VVVVTTDRCYENKWVWGYREINPLGGHHPYSASKAGTELIAASLRRPVSHAPNSEMVSSFWIKAF
jgi:CDP-glucose 4,6-dehydratase